MSTKILYYLIGIGIFFGVISLVAFSLNQNRKVTKTTSSVDTVIIKSSDPKYDLMSQNSNFDSFFPNDLTSSQSEIKFQKGEASVTFSLLSSTKKTSAKNNQNEVIYSKIFQSGSSYIDLKYTIKPDGLSEEFILNQKQNVPKLQQKLNLFNVYAIQNGSQINFYKPLTNDILWFIPAPYMYEQDNPEIKNTGISYSLQCEDSTVLPQDCRTLILTKEITPEGQAWLNDPKRNYPVIIDPNFQLNSGDNSTQWVSSNPSALTVSQETTIKVEGTGSVKIIGTPGPDSCWGVGGNCDSSCANTGIGSSATVYTTCTQGALCANTNCWSADGGSTCDAGCNNNASSASTVYTTCTPTLCTNTNCWTTSGTCDAGCTNNTINSATVYSSCNSSICTGTNCWRVSGGTGCSSGCNKSSCASGGWASSLTAVPCTSGLATRYDCTGTCSSVGSGSCRYPYGGGTRYKTETCSSKYVYDHYYSCSWIPADYSYTASGAFTGYTGSGTCVAGSGNCYKIGSASTYYTGNTACGGSNCTTGSYSSTYSTCAWAAAQYSYATSGAVTGYTGSGTCAAGSGNCYKHTSSTSRYTGNAACGGSNCTTGTYYSTRTTCSWITAKYPYTASSAVVRYSGNGVACNGSGTGSCYKMIPDGSSTYSGNTACGGGSTCAGAATRYTYSACTFYSSSVNQTVSTQTTPTDLSDANTISFWVRSSRTGSYLRFQIGEASSGEQTYDFSINQANTWEQKVFNISGIATTSRDAIQFMAFKVTDLSTAFTMYFDDIQTNIVLNSPQNCRISQNDDNTIFTLNWSDTSSNEEGFLLYKKTDTGAYSLLSTLSPNTSSYIDDVNLNHTYNYQLSSYLTTAGVQITSPPCIFPSLSTSDQGSVKFDNIKLEGVKVN